MKVFSVMGFVIIPAVVFLAASAAWALPKEVKTLVQQMEKNPSALPSGLEKLFALSFDYEAAGNIPDAILTMEQLVRLSQGRFFHQMMRLGSLHMKQGDYRDALKYYTEADEIGSTPDSRQGRLSALLALYRWKEAETVARQILARDPNHTLTLLRQGYILSTLQQYSRALASYEKVLAVFPNDPDALTGKAYVLLAQGKYGPARAIFQHLLLQDPKSPTAQEGLRASRDFKMGIDLYYTMLDFSQTAVRTTGWETGLSPSLSYRNRFVFTPAFTYTDIEFGTISTTKQPSVNLGLWASLSPKYAMNAHLATVQNNDTSVRSTDGGLISYLEIQRQGALFVGASGGYSYYHPDRYVGVAQATLRVGYRFLPGLTLQTKGWYFNSSGPLAPIGPDFNRTTSALEQQVNWNPSAMPGFNLKGTVWTGRKQFPIEADGAQVWNLADILLGGYAVNASYTFLNGQGLYLIFATNEARPPTLPGVFGPVEGRLYDAYVYTIGFSSPL